MVALVISIINLTPGKFALIYLRCSELFVEASAKALSAILIAISKQPKPWGLQLPLLCSDKHAGLPLHTNNGLQLLRP